MVILFLSNCIFCFHVEESEGVTDPGRDDGITFRDSATGKLFMSKDYLQGRANKKAWKHMVVTYAPVMQNEGWKSLSCKKVASEIITPAEEAFILFMLENKDEVWLHEKMIKEGKGRGIAGESMTCPPPRPKWKDLLSNEVSREGVDRYHNLIQQVKDDRSNNNGVEQELLHELQKISGNGDQVDRQEAARARRAVRDREICCTAADYDRDTLEMESRRLRFEEQEACATAVV